MPSLDGKIRFFFVSSKPITYLELLKYVYIKRASLEMATWYIYHSPIVPPSTPARILVVAVNYSARSACALMVRRHDRVIRGLVYTWVCGMYYLGVPSLVGEVYGCREKEK